MGLDAIVNVNITATSPGVTQQGFGIPLIMSHTAAWAERVRTYSSITDVSADCASSTPEYKMAAAIFAQNPKPPSICIGRCANKPTQRRTITPTAVNSAVYKMTVNGTDISFTADSSATAAEIVTGLIALYNAVPGITSTATGSTTLVITANAPGNWDDVSVADPALLSLVQDHADPGAAADLDAILLENDTWYAILNPFNSKLMAVAIAGWTETNKRLYLCGSQDGTIVTTVLSGASDVAATLQTAAYTRTAVLYHPGQARADAAWAGKGLPLNPGSETWALMQLAGVPATKLTSTQQVNAFAKNANVYIAVAGVNVVLTNAAGKGGTSAQGEYIDTVRFIDWMTARIKERVFTVMVSNPKVPYTDAGVQMLAAPVRGTLLEGVAVGGLASFSMQVPKVVDAQPSDKAARVLKNLNFSGVLAGAIHAVQVNGSVSA